MKLVLYAALSALAFLGGAIGGDLINGAQATAPEADGAESNVAATAGGSEEPDRIRADDWFRFPDQFFVPILRNGTTTSVMVMSLTVEIPGSAKPKIEAMEHRLRDALLGALMIRANTGGFDGNFTSEASMGGLRKALLAAAQDVAGPDAVNVLIGDIARQDQ